ncbi:MAG: hypothetical protein KDB65_08455 [Calditrichaeota bacterium]|nr:hypothetical protein [Calditrichota bacterium]MCB9369834.1 hypothetical protein [Calditrichota bacterium]
MFTYTLFPAILLVFFGGLLSMWVTLYHKPDEVLERIAGRIGWFTLIVYAAWLTRLSFEQRQIPILTAGQISVFLGFLVWMDQLLVQRKISQRMLVVLPLITVVVLLLSGIAAGLRHTTAPLELHSAWSAVHIVMSMAGIAMLLGSGVFGAGSILLRRQLKSRNFGRLFSSLPSMDEMHKLRTFAIYLGWVLITVSFASAVVFMFVEKSGNPSFFSHLHEMFALWFVASLLALSERMHWFSDQKQARFAVATSAVIFLLIAGTVLQIFFGGQS